MINKIDCTFKFKNLDKFDNLFKVCKFPMRFDFNISGYSDDSYFCVNDVKFNTLKDLYSGNCSIELDNVCTNIDYVIDFLNDENSVIFSCFDDIYIVIPFDCFIRR